MAQQATVGHGVIVELAFERLDRIADGLLVPERPTRLESPAADVGGILSFFQMFNQLQRRLAEI